jgi:hypothetical protein
VQWPGWLRPNAQTITRIGYVAIFVALVRSGVFFQAMITHDVFAYEPIYDPLQLLLWFIGMIIVILGICLSRFEQRITYLENDQHRLRHK